MESKHPDSGALDEKRRLKALYSYDILDTIPEKEYDSITKIAAQICNVPVSLITFLDRDRQWFKSHNGIEINQTPREFAFCNHTILEPLNVLAVPDLRIDDRFSRNPLVTGTPHAVFYAGASLVTPDGNALGSICVLDAKANKLDDNQKNALKALAEQVVARLELRKKIKDLKFSQQKLKKVNRNLRQFAHVISHDMKTPLANISLVSQSLQTGYPGSLDNNACDCLDLINKSAKELLLFIDDVLIKCLKPGKSTRLKKVDSYAVISKVIDLIALPADIEIKISGSFPRIQMEKTSLQQVFQNLITNAIKYNDKEKGIINISCYSDHGYHYFDIADNGCGIDNEDLEKIFNKRQTLKKTDRYGNIGTGTGLAMVKNIIEQTGGEISVASEKDAGSVFKISIPCISMAVV